MVGQDRLTGRRLPGGAAEEEEPFTKPEPERQQGKSPTWRRASTHLLKEANYLESVMSCFRKSHRSGYILR